MSDGLELTSDPLISVVMPFYDAAAYLGAAIGSIERQTHRRWELILVDDGSRDQSAAIAADHAAGDSRIHAITVSHRGGGAAANAGLRLAQGDLIARMDADDIAAPERFAVQLDWMRRTGADVCGACATRFGDHDGVLWFPETHEGIVRELLFRRGLLHPTMLTHATVLKANPYREHVGAEDYELYTRLARRQRMSNVPAVLLAHRCHPRQSHLVRQSHPAGAAAYAADVRAHRRAAFSVAFPDGSPDDARTLAKVAELVPFSTLDELEHAGRLLARLADSPEFQVRREMLARWRRCTRVSAHLGSGAYRTYRRLVPAFGTASRQDERPLRAACALRLRRDSALERTLRRARRWWSAR